MLLGRSENSLFHLPLFLEFPIILPSHIALSPLHLTAVLYHLTVFGLLQNRNPNLRFLPKYDFRPYDTYDIHYQVKPSRLFLHVLFLRLRSNFHNIVSPQLALQHHGLHGILHTLGRVLMFFKQLLN